MRHETNLERATRLRAQARISEANRLVRRPAEDSPRGYARIQAARAKRARRNAKRLVDHVWSHPDDYTWDRGLWKWRRNA